MLLKITHPRLAFNFRETTLVYNPLANERDRAYPEKFVTAMNLFDVTDDAEDPWFAFWEEDCMAPPIYVIRAANFEDAYEHFCDEVVGKHPISEADLEDYRLPDGELSCNYTSSGVPINTDSVSGCEIFLDSVREAKADPGDTHISVLRIDAWREATGWTWNSWHKIDSVPVRICDLPKRKLLAYLREKNILGDGSKGSVYVEDDQHNLVVRKRGTDEPLVALAYGEVIS